MIENGRRRCCWFEVRNGEKVICVSRTLPRGNLWTYADLDLFAVINPVGVARQYVFGQRGSRVIEALEYVPQRQLGHVCDLLRSGFVVCR